MKNEFNTVTHCDRRRTLRDNPIYNCYWMARVHRLHFTSCRLRARCSCVLNAHRSSLHTFDRSIEIFNSVRGVSKQCKIDGTCSAYANTILTRMKFHLDALNYHSRFSVTFSSASSPSVQPIRFEILFQKRREKKRWRFLRFAYSEPIEHTDGIWHACISVPRCAEISFP